MTAPGPRLSPAGTRDMSPAEMQAADVADLERLAAELTARGFRTSLHAPPGRLPCLDVTNPRASVLAERVYAQAGSYWYSWAERIACCDEPATAAATLARVLRTADGD